MQKRSRKTNLAAAIAAAAIAAPLAAGAAPAAGQPATPDVKAAAAAPAPIPAPPVSDLTAIGLDLEAARALPAAESEAALRNVAAALAAREKAGVPKERQGAFSLLSGEVHLALGEPEEARRAFERAAKSLGGKNVPDGRQLAAAAELARIQSLEAAGRDDEAAAAWRKSGLVQGYGPLAGEARLALAWNRMRMGELEEAAQLLATLAADTPWMVDDARCAVATGALAYLEGRHAEALAALAPAAGGAATRPATVAAATYLRALCHHALGEHLKAAATFQEVADRHRGSPLAEHALLAKANVFLEGGAWQSAAEEFERVLAAASTPTVRAEAAVRRAACRFLAGEVDAALPLLRQVTTDHPKTEAAARAQFLLGEAALSQGRHEEAIREFNRVLTSHFDAAVAASAQYRVGRCLDALGRRIDATGAYQAVVQGYPLEPEAPAAAYLAGVGLLDQNRPQAAIPLFQLVLDRYASSEGADGTIVFASPEHQELVEAALCLLQLSYHRVGDLGQLAGAPHVLLQRMAPSQSPWRAYALLIDADALAAQARHDEARAGLDQLLASFPDHPAAVPANQLLAWIHAQQGEAELAIRTQQKLLERYGETGDRAQLARAFLGMAHVRFNRQEYKEAAAGYEEFLARYPDHPERLLALYQAGLCYLRGERAGDAVDRWEVVVREDPQAPVAERAWARAGDVYFQAEKHEDARRCYEGLLANFGGSRGAAVGQLRIAQCDYNRGLDAEALAGFASVLDRFAGTREAREAERGIELALYRLGQQAEGEDELRRLVQEHPTSSFAADAQFRLAQRLYEKEQFAEAAEEFRRVVSQFPACSVADRAQFLLADARARAGQAAEARQALEQFLLFFAQSELAPTVRFRLGMLYFEGGEHLRAAVEFTAVLDRNPAEETARAALYNLALCQHLLGREQEALASLDDYRRRWPADERAAEIALQLADIHERGGRTAEAEAELQRALQADPPAAVRTEAQYRLGRCREAAGDAKGALAAYEKAVASKERGDAFRLSALARAAAIYEQGQEWRKALAAYRDLAEHATDPELAAAASGRAGELATLVKQSQAAAKE